MTIPVTIRREDGTTRTHYVTTERRSVTRRIRQDYEQAVRVDAQRAEQAYRETLKKLEGR